MSVGEKIKELRLGKGLSIGELASLAKVSKSYISYLERGIEENPSIKTLRKISGVLGVDVIVLMIEEQS